ncbi:YihY/virulence factor BrkB family protein [Streptomonospora wellingtoniae]|uniref:YihY/virulence factor BrkB family protein n=1 Tax=Streptomonospora wellingtoniae TaxID=3075544 RepID=UPI0037D9CAF3
MRGLWSRTLRGAGDRVAAWRERHPVPGALLLLAGRTVRALSRARVVGLAAESAFFSLLSLPALLLGLVGTLGHLRPMLGNGTVLEIRAWMLDLAATVLTSDTVDSLVAPLVDEFLRGAQGGLLSVTFLVSLWSGSRAMNVFIDAITIAYGLDELRGFLRQRVLALLAYLGGLLFALAVLPVLVAGPDLVHRLLPATVGYLHLLYWPLVCALSTLAVAMLYVLSTPVRTPLWRYLPGALMAMAVLLAGSALLRVYLDASFGQVTIYGSLAAPIAILVWLWLMALAVLVGSALNAETDAMWPTPRTAAARAEIAGRRHERARRMVQRREEALEATGRPDESGETSAEIAARMRRLMGWGTDRLSEDTDPGAGPGPVRRRRWGGGRTRAPEEGPPPGGPSPEPGKAVPGDAVAGEASEEAEPAGAPCGEAAPAEAEDAAEAEDTGRPGSEEPEEGGRSPAPSSGPAPSAGPGGDAGSAGPQSRPRAEDREAPGASS